MRTLLLGVAAAVAMGMGAARAQSPSNVQAVYDRICTGAAPASEKTCAALRQDLHGGPRAAPAPAPAASVQVSAPAPKGPPNWGGLDTLAGRTFQRRITTALRMASDTASATHTFRWIKPGVSLEDELVASYGAYKTVYTIDPATNVVAGFSWDPEGYLATTPGDMNGTPVRRALKVVGGVYEEHAQVQKGGRWRTMLMGKETYESADVIQQRQADRSAFWGSVVQGAVAAIPVLTDPNGGASALSSAPLMREDGSAPNLLETLNGVSAQLQQQNAEGKARLDAMIADGERQRRAREAQAAAEASARRQASQQRLGQTPIGALPGATMVRSQAAQPAPAPENPRFARGEVGCHDHAGSESPFQCRDLDHAQSGSQPTSGRGLAGGTQVATSGGGIPGSRPTTAPPGLKPPAGIEYETRREGVTLCELKGPQAQFKNWTCVGPLQMNYVNFEKPNWPYEMRLTCGGNNMARDLGTAGGYRAFGCGFAINGSDNDIPLRFGVGYVPDRMSFRCRKDRVACMQ